MCVYSLGTMCCILVLLVGFSIIMWNSTEMTSSVYHVQFTADRKEITLNPFPYDVSGVSVSIPTSEGPCYWIVNNSQHHNYLFNNTYILLLPFGKNFTNTRILCPILETGTIYRLLIGDTCPCKNLIVRVTSYNIIILEKSDPCRLI